MEKELMLRDTLALDRTRLANQRTLLSYIRTGIYLAFTGMGIFQFSETNRFNWLAWSLIGASIIVAILGIFNFFRMARKINKVY